MTIRTQKPHALIDRIPPYSEDAERAVLGACFLNADAFGQAVEIINSPSLFYFPAHAHIYEAMLASFREGQPIDALVLKERLLAAGRLEDIGGLTYLADLSSAVPTSANVQHYAEIVLEKFTRRGMISTAAQVNNLAFDESTDVETALDTAQAELFRLAEHRQTNPIEPLSALLPAAVERIENAKEQHSGCTGIGTGFRYLDDLTAGFQPSDMVVLAARPSLGKTSIALHIARRAAIDEGKGVLIFSLEMSNASLVQRILAAHAGVSATRLRGGWVQGQDLDRIRDAANALGAANIFIDDTPGVSAMELRAKARRHASRNKVDLIVVDYIQLMHAGGRHENRQSEVSEISRSIKAVGREINVPIIALSQLNRAAESDEGRPKLSNLRESGAIEQDADVVLLMSRVKNQTEGASMDRQQIILDLAKQRNGPTGEQILVFEKNTQRWSELASEREQAKVPARVPSQSWVDEREDEMPF